MNLRSKIELLILEAIQEAKKKHPKPFVDAHHGWANIFEEITEAQKEIEKIHKYEEAMRSHVFEDLDAVWVVEVIEKHAINLIQEAIDIVVTTRKYKNMGRNKDV